MLVRMSPSYAATQLVAGGGGGKRFRAALDGVKDSPLAPQNILFQLVLW